MDTFDYIVVGAGSAGCALAGRLSECPDIRILLIEAGGANDHPFVAMPRGFSRISAKPYFFWEYALAVASDRQAETWRYGKGFGGASAVNGMWYMRGMPSDFNAWEKAGNAGWGWTDVEKTYKSMESYWEKDAHESRGIDGPLQVTKSVYQSPVVSAMLDAGVEVGLPLLGDVNQPNTDGIGLSQFSIDRSGRRASSYAAFVKPAKKRSNLVIRHGVEVKHIEVRNGKACGIVCEESGSERTYRSKGEIILSAGAIQSPKILMLSGIGPPDVLRKAGVQIVHPLAAVGRNLGDHPMVSMTFELENDPKLHLQFTTFRLYLRVLQYYAGLKGFMATGAVPVTMMMSDDEHKSWPNILIGMIPIAVENRRQKKSGAFRRKRFETRPAVMFLGYSLRPKSRGTISIVSPDHRMAPKIIMDWREHPEDRAVHSRIVRSIRQLSKTNALSTHIGEEVVDDGVSLNSDEVLQADLPPFKSGLHGNGSCRMGPDPSVNVVDSQLRVHGIDNLRVADASIMPTPVSGNTNASAMMIGTRAADLILESRFKTQSATPNSN